MANVKLDRFDIQLLELVQRDATLSGESMGERVGLSASAVQRRLKRLRASGVISSTVAVLDPAKVGSPPFFVVGLELERERPELVSKLREWLSEEDAVEQAYYVTGNSDLLLFIVVPDIPSFDGFMARLVAENANIRRFSTNVVLGAYKRRLSLPLNATRE